MTTLADTAVPVRGESGLLAALRQFFAKMGVLGVVALAFFVLVVVVAIFAAQIAPYDPNSLNLLDTFGGPSTGHILGTDELGRDIFSRLVWATRPSLIGPLLVVVIATAVGVPLALLAAWRGGVVDTVIGRTFDVLFAFPSILLAVLVVALFGSGMLPCAIALGIAYTPWIGRVTRGAALRERSMPYVAACEVQGFRGLSICWRHVLPNIRSIIIAQFTVNFGYALVDLAALSFLGLATQPPTSDLGVLVNSQEAILRGHPAEAIYAGILIVLCVTAVTYIGHRIADDSGSAR